MKKRSIKIACISIISAFALVGATVSTIAWFSTLTNISFGNKNNPKVRAGMETFPYASGTGDAEDDPETEEIEGPYIINKRNHLYNLAWKQYLGHYNINASTQQQSIQRCYFKLGADIDMTGLTLPPIGTDTFPFYGYFDGDGYTISNLTVSNDNPKKQGSTDFGIARPANSVIPEYAVPSEIIGFFGVVGDLPGDNVTYNSQAPSVENVTLDNLKIKTCTEETLVGLAAGYVNGDVSDVRVGSSEIEINDCAPITSITENLSDYSLVGYCADTNTVSDFTKKISEKVHKEVSGGIIGGFGASVAFKEYTSWIYKLHQNKSYDGGRMQNALNQKSGTNYHLNVNTGSVSYSISNPDVDFTITFVSGQTSYSFAFTQTSNSTYSGTFTRYDSSSGDTREFTATLDVVSSKNRYNITMPTSLSLFNNLNAFAVLQTSSGATGYYVVKSGSTSTGSTNRVINNQFTYTASHIYHLTDDCYIPLKFSDSTNASVSKTNTGYIVGTSLIENNKTSVSSPRISSYSSSYLSGSMTNGSISSIKTYYSGQWSTITDTKTNGVVTDCIVKEDENGTTTASKNPFQRYLAARNTVAGFIEGQRAIHGIHFDVHASNVYKDGSGNNTTYNRGSIYEGAYVEKTALFKSYDNQPKLTRMPKGGIDFELEDSGYITFFAGMYNTAPTALQLNFFSLFHVDRESETSYTLKEIEKIYKASTWSEQNEVYVYKYLGENEPASHGALVIDLSTTLWTAKDKDNSLYYFEIPVNQGEYCMGAVNKANSGNTAYQGAYMMYLDIGSNGKSAGNNTMDAFYSETSSNSDIFPDGVDFDITGLSTVGGQTGCLAIQYTSGTVNGSVTFVVATNVAVDATIEDCNINYEADEGIFNVTGSTEEIGDITGSSNPGRRVIIASINMATGASWNIEYQEKLDGSGGTYTRIVENSLDRTSEGSSIVPSIFTSNIANIRSAIMAVQLDFTGTDFNVTNATYSGTTISLTIPPEELGDTELDVTFGTHYSTLNINGSAYPTS